MNWFLLAWMCGVFIALLSLAAGRLALLRMARRARPAGAEQWEGLLREACGKLAVANPPDLLVLPKLTMPFAFGLRRPKIVLPGDCERWSDFRKRIVLLHELAHIKRRDIAAQLFANLVAALWWFQPLVWIARRELRREGERACDAEALSAGVRASEYAAELIEIARSASRGRLWTPAATTMARPGELESRLFGILNANEPLERARRRLLASAVILTLLAITASAVTISPNQKFRNSRNSGGLLMKRTLLSGLLATVGLSAATITGSVFDPSGASIYNAKISLTAADSTVKQDAASAADGKFTFDNLPAGQYFVRVEKPGFAPLLREITVAENSTVDRAFSMQAATPTNAQASGGGLQSTDPMRIRRGGEAMQAMLINKVSPIYPATAKSARIQGTVSLEAIILKDGTPGELTVVSSPSDDLSQASLDAVRQWRYQPTLLNGQPVEVVTYIIVNFTLLP